MPQVILQFKAWLLTQLVKQLLVIFDDEIEAAKAKFKDVITEEASKALSYYRNRVGETEVRVQEALKEKASEVITTSVDQLEAVLQDRLNKVQLPQAGGLLKKLLPR